MREHPKKRRVGRHEGVFRLLTRLYPARFRDEYEKEMQAVLREDHAQRETSSSRLSFWIRSITASLREAPREHLSDLGLDLRYSLRTLRRRPVFLLVSVLSLGIGIGAATTVTATLSELFLQPIPGIPDASGLINVKPKTEQADGPGGASYPYFLALREEAKSLDDLMGFSGVVATIRLRPGDEPEPRLTQLVTSNYFELLGAELDRGRFFSEEEERAAAPMVVVSGWFWRERLGSPDLSSESPVLWINGVRTTVIGVAGGGFRGNFKGFSADLFLPLGSYAQAGLRSIDDPEARVLEVVGQRASGVGLAEAGQELERLADLLGESDPIAYGDLRIEVEPMTGIDADFRSGLLTFLVALLVVTLLILGIASLNVAGMMASRAVERENEIAVRLALGAPRSRLTRQLVVETLLLGLLAAGVGTALAHWATRQVGGAFATVDPRIALEVNVDRFTLTAAIVLAAVVAMLAAAASGRAVSGLQPLSRRGLAPRQRWRRALVLGQVVLSFVVLIVAALFLRALQAASDIDVGFEPNSVVAASINPSLAQMDMERSHRLFLNLREEVEARSPVARAALATRIPLSLGARFFPNPVELNVAGQTPPTGSDGFQIESATVSRDYFDVFSIPLVSGRPPTRGEEEEAAAVVVVNEEFERRFFPTGGAIGRTVTVEDEELRIVGVAKDSKYRTLDEATIPFVYRSFWHRKPRRAVLLAQAAGPTPPALTALRETQLRLEPELPVQELGRLTDRLASALLPQRVGASAAGALGLLGLLLATVGLTGVITHWVNSRKREIGLRVSLGAKPSNVFRLVLRQGAGLAVVGVLVGLPLAIGIATLLAGFLYNVSPVDPRTYLLVGGLQLLAALAASSLPLWKALRLDPLQALRSE